MDNKKWKIAIVIVVVILVIGIGTWLYLRSMTAGNGLANKVVNVPASQLPNDFPSIIPIEKGAVIVSNFNASAPNGQVQATRSFDSAKSVAENLRFYELYILTSRSGWIPISSVNDPSDPNHAAVYARDLKGGMLSITISLVNPQPFISTLVTITYTTPPTIK